jgi:uncharacterized protein
MSIFATISQYARMLRNLDQWLETAVAHAQAKGFDPEVLVQARLAPDQFALVRQVQSACDAAKYAAAYLSDQKAPSHPDTEKTMAEVRARVRTCIAYLETFKQADFAGGEERRVAPAWMEGKLVTGDKYLTRISEPNFYFHATTAYDILRQKGVPLGKRDYLGRLRIAS